MSHAEGQQGTDVGVRTGPGGQDSPAGPAGADAGATVLVVEDEPSIADVLAIALRYHRFDVMVAGTVREALALAGRTRPDVALLDVM
ncbi:MAG: response regulator, partial [Streptomyces sp.]